MAFDEFTPALAPAPGSGWDYQVAVRRVEYGDGYSQRQEDGINSRRPNLELSWPLLTDAQANTLETFFRTHIATPFNYRPPWNPSASLSNWLWTVVAPWQRISIGTQHAELRVTFRREFDLEV